jgi:6 kDa early secretory antigenic target
MRVAPGASSSFGAALGGSHERSTTMAIFQVDSDAVLQTTAATQTTVGRIQNEVQTLMSQLTGLESTWRGTASTAFQGLVSEWRATQHRVEENLETIRQALGVAGQQYSETEQANIRLFGH